MRAFVGETNPIIVRDEVAVARYWADLHGQSEETIGTNSIDSYFRFARDFARTISVSHTL